MFRKRETSIVAATLSAAVLTSSATFGSGGMSETSAAAVIAQAVAQIDAATPAEGRAHDRILAMDRYIQVELDNAQVRPAALVAGQVNPAVSREESQNLRRAQTEVFRALRRLNLGHEQEALAHASHALDILAQPAAADDVDPEQLDHIETGSRRAEEGRR